jgi:hypothetical protein
MISNIDYKESVKNATDGIEAAKLTLDFGKIDKTLTITLEYFAAAGAILIIDGVIRRIKWYDFRIIAKLARLSYDFIVKLYEIWKG